MTDLDIALQQFNDARGNFFKVAKAELGSALAGIFDNPKVETVAWGQKYSEYNDEGMYPGVHGPVINKIDPNDDVSNDYWDYLGGYNSSSSPGFEKEVNFLSDILEKIGAETLGEIVGNSDENFIIVSRGKDGSLKIIAEYAGY